MPQPVVSLAPPPRKTVRRSSLKQRAPCKGPFRPRPGARRESARSAVDLDRGEPSVHASALAYVELDRRLGNTALVRRARIVLVRAPNRVILHPIHLYVLRAVVLAVQVGRHIVLVEQRLQV